MDILIGLWNRVPGMGDRASCVLAGFYTVDQNERAVKTIFGRAERIGSSTTLDDPIAESLHAEEKERYCVPAGPGDPAGRPLFQMALGEGLQGLDRHRDGEHGLRSRNRPRPTTTARVLEAVTKDQLEHRPDRPDPLSRSPSATSTPISSA